MASALGTPRGELRDRTDNLTIRIDYPTIRSRSAGPIVTAAPKRATLLRWQLP
jgi:hypothetical protein